MLTAMKKQNKPRVTLESIDRKIDEMGTSLAEAIQWSYNKLDQKIDFRFGQLESRIDHLAEDKVSRDEHKKLVDRVSKVEGKIGDKLSLQN
jgi:hypothetical protein